MDLKLYLALTGAVGLAYVSYTYLNKPKVIYLPKDLTKRICQEIKHQMMIVCITYSKAMKKIREDNGDKLKGKQQIFIQFRGELSQVYVSKQQLILKKYSISRQTYGKSLQKWKHEKSIIKNTTQILEMMQRSINGQTPDFTIAAQATKAFTKDGLCEIYKDMVTLIGKKVTHKLQQQTDRNPNFNSNSDDDFRNAIRELSIYDIKVDFLKSRGFKEEWGCPNQIFFKYLEAEKTKDEAYQKKVVAYEKCYEKIIQLVSADPKGMTDRKIDDLFASALKAPIVVKTPAVQPAKPAVVQPQPIRAVQPKKVQPVDEDAQLEALMMQQLMNRSQQQPQPVQLGQSVKIGLTQSQIQQDWQKHGSIHQKEHTKLEDATDEIGVGIKDEALIKSQQKVVDQALKEAEEEQAEKAAEQGLINAQVPESDQMPIQQQATIQQQVLTEQNAPIDQQPAVQEQLVQQDNKSYDNVQPQEVITEIITVNQINQAPVQAPVIVQTPPQVEEEQAPAEEQFQDDIVDA